MLQIPMRRNYLYNIVVGEMAELVYGARLESVLGRKALAGSNPVLSAKKNERPSRPFIFLDESDLNLRCFCETKVAGFGVAQ